MTHPDFTISTLAELNRLVADNQNIRAIIFDIDGTLSRGDIVTTLFTDSLKELSLPHFDIKSTLGRQNWLTESWLAQHISISYGEARRLIALTKERFLQLTTEDFRSDLFDETTESLSKLNELNLSLGIFTMRHWQLALHQITHSGLSKYIDQKADLIPNSPMRLTGSRLSTNIERSGADEKTEQLKLHKKSLAYLKNSEIAVVGDIVESDIVASNRVGMKAILIER